MADTLTSRVLEDAAKERAANAERDEREHKLVVETLERNGTMWFRLAIAELVVLLVLVAGVVGVGVTGSIPGIGELTIVQPEEAEPEAVEPVPSE